MTGTHQHAALGGGDTHALPSPAVSAGEAQQGDRGWENQFDSTLRTSCSYEFKSLQAFQFRLYIRETTKLHVRTMSVVYKMNFSISNK